MGGEDQPQVLTQVLLKAANGTVASKAVAQPRFIVGGPEVYLPGNTMHAKAEFGRVAGALSQLGMPVKVPAQNCEVVGYARLISMIRDGARAPRANGYSAVAQRMLQR